ncbi:MAG: diguanylate cyclase domain-containing protein [Aestuariivirga sp.]
MFNRIQVLLALIGAAIFALVGAYGAVLYAGAVEADATQDSRNRALIAGELESHRIDTRESLEALAVSDAVFAAAQSNNSAQLTKLLCDHTDSSGRFSTIGVMSFSGQALFLCESGQVKYPGENDYVFELPRKLLQQEFDGFLGEQNSYRSILPEFQFTELYADVAGRHYLIGAAVSAPESKRAMPAAYRPAIVFGFAGMRNMLRELDERLGTGELRLARADGERSNVSLPIGGGNHGQAMAVVWTASHAFRDQLLRFAPPIVLPSVAVLLLIGYFLTRIERSRATLLASETRMRHMALHDELTGLPNRTHFQDLLAQAVADTSNGKLCYVAVFDVDYFKSVNDTHGHDVGDMLLEMIAMRAVAALGPQNSVARLGGDEFAVILRNVRDNSEAFKLLSAMGKSIAGAMHIGAIQINPGVSIGAAPIRSNARTATEIMKRADLALYEVKAHGRGHCRLFSDESAFRVQEASAAGLY